MSTKQNTLWESFLQPIFQLIIDPKPLKELSTKIDWETLASQFSQPNITYPNYYLNGKFHGIEAGYLTKDAAITYDPITQYVLPPNETWVRQELIETISGKPRRILDLGCGTGSTTLMLKQTFPEAEVTGLDLSPYMLVMAEYKAKQARLSVNWQHSKAETTGLKDGSFELVTASLLFNEIPTSVSKAILQECFRLLVPGGQVIILDGNQYTIRHSDWLTNVFEEPYMREYSQGSIDAWLGATGFEAIQTEHIWWIHQVTRGIKPIVADSEPIPISNYQYAV